MMKIETTPVAPRTFWKENGHKFPALASLACDVLSIPATGAGVERLFNSARDICLDLAMGLPRVGILAPYPRDGYRLATHYPCPSTYYPSRVTRGLPAKYPFMHN